MCLSRATQVGRRFPKRVTLYVLPALKDPNRRQTSRFRPTVSLDSLGHSLRGSKQNERDGKSLLLPPRRLDRIWTRE